MSDEWFDLCIERAFRCRSFAHSMFRLDRIDPMPSEWGIESRFVTDGKTALRDGWKWIREARAERERLRYADDMRKLRSRASRLAEMEPGEVALHEGQEASRGLVCSP